MKIRQVDEAKKWLDFITANPGKSGVEFLISPEWVDILSKEGKEVKVLAVSDDKGDFLALAVLIKNSIKGKLFYWYLPRGPVIKLGLLLPEKKKVLDLFFSEIKKIDKKAVFIKIEPAQFDDSFWFDYFKINEISFKEADHVQPKKTLVLDLMESEENILANMHQKTRYNIRLAAKKGVNIVEGNAKDFSEFWRLMTITGSRDGFRIHNKKHYQNLLVSNNESDLKFIKLFFAEYKGNKIATALICFFGDKVTYLHGGSDNAYRNVMAPYLLQWEMIKRAKEREMKNYDFYGIDKLKWPGVTRFKFGFGGEEKVYPGVFDVIFKGGDI